MFRIDQKRKTLLVIGGGFAGITIIQQTCRNFNVILIDPKLYFEYVPSVFYCFINPNHIFNQMIPYSEICKAYKITHIPEKIKKIEGSYVYYEGGGKVQFDYCAIANGSIQKPPIKSVESKPIGRFLEIKRIQNFINKAQSILIIGGGTVGVEAACEIKCGYLQKTIAIVARRQFLMNMPPKARLLLLDRMNQLRLEYKENYDAHIIKEKFDLVFDCTGNRFECIQNGEIFIKQDEFKQLNVDDFLQVRGLENVFAAGDIALSPLGEQKTAFSAEMYGELVAHNIKCLTRQKRLKKLGWIPQTYIISIGGWKAILIFEEFCFGGVIPFLMKLFVERVIVNDYKGVFGFYILHQIMNYALYIMLHFYMVIQLILALLPLGGRIKPELREELRRLQSEIPDRQRL